MSPAEARRARQLGAAKSRRRHEANAAGRREDYSWLRDEQHLTIEQAAARMRVTYRTAQRWEQLRREAVGS